MVFSAPVEIPTSRLGRYEGPVVAIVRIVLLKAPSSVCNHGRVAGREGIL